MRATTKLVMVLAAIAPGAAFAQREPEPTWSRIPSPSQVLDAYPAAAKDLPGGMAKIKCLPGPTGVLIDCEVLSEEPAGVGFGQAAVELAAGFRLTRQAAKRHQAGMTLPIRFTRPEPAPPWREAVFNSSSRYSSLGVAGPYYPERAFRMGVGGEVVVDWRVAADDLLKDCKIVDARPSDFGFDDSVLRMSQTGWMRAGPAPIGSTPVKDDVWRFKVPFSDTKGRFAR